MPTDTRKVFHQVLTLFIGCYFLILYLVPPLKLYTRFQLQLFDYGILYHSTYLLSHLKSAFLTVRGVHVWADNQDYFQLALSLLHDLPAPQYWLLVTHSLAIFACGLVCYRFLRPWRWAALGVAITAWSSPFLLNMNRDVIHTEAFATLFLLLMGIAWAQGRRLMFFSCLVAALCCKEDVAITVAAFCLVALLLRRQGSELNRRAVFMGLLLACGIFVVNGGVVLPYAKLQTCRELDPTFSLSSTQLVSRPLATWFAGLFDRWQNPVYYAEVFVKPQVLFYLLRLLWPLFFVLRGAGALILLPIPGALINVLSGTGYLIEATWHYDHSTYAMVLIAVLLGIRKLRHRTAMAAILAAGSLLLNPLTQPPFRTRLHEPFSKSFWELRKAESVRILERLNQHLANDIVIAADYTSINYLLEGRERIFMFPAPLAVEWPLGEGPFGISGVCSKFRHPPAVDCVILRPDYLFKPAVRGLLDKDFEELQIPLQDTRRHLTVFLNRRSPHYPALQSTLSRFLSHS